MKVSLEDVQKILGNFAIVLPAPKIVDADAFFLIWHGVLATYEFSDVRVACARLLRKLKTFPVPADVVIETDLLLSERREIDTAASK